MWKLQLTGDNCSYNGDLHDLYVSPNIRVIS